MSRTSRMLIYFAMAMAVATFIAIYVIFDPSVSSFFPRCPFLQLTGLKCPGCGSQRAIHALLHGDVCGAARFNFLLVISIPVIVLYSFLEVCKMRFPRAYNLINSPKIVWSIFAVVALWWVLRNMFVW